MPQTRLIFLCWALFLLWPAVVHAEQIDRVVAEINDDVITLSDLNEEGQELFARIEEQVPPLEQAAARQDVRQEILTRLIDKMIINQKAAALGLTVTETEVDDAINHILARNETTMADFRRDLTKAGFTEDKYRASIREQILQSKLVNYEVRSKIVITDEKIKDYYAKNYARNIKAGGYYILQMGFVWDQGAAGKKEARQRAEQAWERARAGENFSDLARLFSDLPSAADGGDLGVLREPEMAPYMRDTILVMPAGEISPIIETESGYQFFKLLSSRDGAVVTQAPYDSVKEEIQDLLYQAEMEKQYEKWVKKLREQAYIKKFL